MYVYAKTTDTCTHRQTYRLSSTKTYVCTYVQTIMSTHCKCNEDPNTA